MNKKYFIKTFGCSQNIADSEKISSAYKTRGFTKALNYKSADHIIINTCMIRESAENRVYGLVNNLKKLKNKPRIIVTGCMVGIAYRDRSGQFIRKLKKALPQVHEFLPIEKIISNQAPLRTNKTHALVPISNGCNNFCTYCVVPLARGQEVSIPFAEIIKECKRLKKQGYQEVTLLGQNVNSYGADLIKNSKLLMKGKKIKPAYVKHLGRLRIPTLFPNLLEEVAKLEFKKIDFMSSNPWDFSDELIKVIKTYPNITRTIHLPVQSGDNKILKKMNRWYTSKQYLALITKLKAQIPKIQFTTDIIVGFCGETEEQFQNTVNLCQQVNFQKAYISMYSSRPLTAATKVMADDISYSVKKKRWQILDTLINKYEH